MIMVIKSFDKMNVASLEEDLKAAMRVVAAKHGVHFSPQGGKYDGASLKLRFEFLVIENDTGKPQDPHERNLKLYWPDAVGLMVNTRGHGICKIVGYYRKGHDRRFIFESYGKRYRVHDDAIVFDELREKISGRLNAM